MAGTAGMATPKSVGSMTQVAPQAPPQVPDLPPEQAAPMQQDSRPSLDSIFVDAQPRRPSLDDIFKAPEALKQPESSVGFTKALGDTFMQTPGGMVLNAVAKGAEGVMGVGQQMVSNAVEKYKNPNSDVGLLTKTGHAFVNPEDTKGVGQSLSEIFPGMKGTLHRPSVSSMNALSPGDLNNILPMQTPDNGIKQEPANTTYADAIDIAGQLAMGEAEIRGASKIATITKLIDRGLEGVSVAAKGTNKASMYAQPAEYLDNAVNGIKQTDLSLSAIDQKIPLDPYGKNLTDPEMRKMAQSVNDSAKVQAVKQAHAEQVVNTIEDIPKTIIGLKPTGKNTDDILKVIQQASNFEGNLVNEYRVEASKILGKNKVSADNFSAKVNELANKIGAKMQPVVQDAKGAPIGVPIEPPKTVNLPEIPSKEAISKSLKVDEGEAKYIRDHFKGIFQDNFNSKGKMTFDELHGAYNDLADEAKRAQNKLDMSYNARQFWYDLRRSAGEDLRGATGNALKESNPAAFEAYDKANSGYSKSMNAIDDLGAIIDKGEVTAGALADYFSTKAIANPDRFRAATTILELRNPEMVADLKNEMWNRLLFKHTDINPTVERPFGINLEGLAKDLREWKGHNPNATNLLDMYTGSKAKSAELWDVIKAADKFQKSYIPNAPALKNEKLLGRFFYYAKEASITSPESLIEPFLKTAARDKNIATMLKNVDPAKMAEMFPPAKRAEGIEFMKAALKTSLGAE